jgi:hypothetical protein
MAAGAQSCLAPAAWLSGGTVPRQGDEPIGHPRVVLTQALAKHIEQLVALQDDLRTETIARYKQLCETCGCRNEQELSEALSAERKPRRCPLARFLRVCGQLGVQAHLPACLSLGKAERDTSWHSLLTHLSRLASASDADEDFRSDLEQVTASWAAIRHCFRGRGIKQPRQLVLDPRARPAIWLLPHSISRRPRWLDALRRVLPRVDAAALFPRLDRGVSPHGTTSVRAPAHQVLLHEVVKVKAHAGDPLNEAADTLASDAAEFDPSHSQEVDPEGVHFGYKGSLWNSRLRRELTQVAAAQWAAKCVRPIVRGGQMAPRHVPITTS